MSKVAEFGGTTFTTPSDRELVATRVVDAPRTLVWDAHTRPEHIRQWLLGPDGWSMPICEMEVRPGGKWHWVWGKEGEQGMDMSGEFREVVKPERMVQTENWGGDWKEAVDTLVLTDEDGKTRLTTTVVYPTKDERDRAMATGMEEGWAKSYDRLDGYVRTMAREA